MEKSVVVLGRIYSVDQGQTQNRDGISGCGKRLPADNRRSGIGTFDAGLAHQIRPGGKNKMRFTGGNFTNLKTQPLNPGCKDHFEQGLGLCLVKNRIHQNFLTMTCYKNMVVEYSVT